MGTEGGTGSHTASAPTGTTMSDVSGAGIAVSIVNPAQDKALRSQVVGVGRAPRIGAAFCAAPDRVG
jgi:hypothetical protein